MSEGGQQPLDQLQRPLHDLRISVIDRCNFRCPYCMPVSEYAADHEFMARADWLTFDEIKRVAWAFNQLGVSKLRLTGGEPLLRPGLDELVALLRQIDGIEEIAMSTNGLLLPRYASDLKAAGLDRITVSLDSVDQAGFGEMSGGQGTLDGVLAGIDAAHAAGFPPVKINMVVIRGENEDQVLPMVQRFRQHGVIVRFIEYMDVGNRNGWRLDQVVPWRELLQRITERWPLTAVAPRHAGEVAKRYRFADGQGEVGFITSITEPFCGGCSRARLAADGQLYTCLFAGHGHDIRSALRAGIDQDGLQGLLAAIWRGRTDRYSELRLVQQQDHAQVADQRVEMYRVGG
ncbi:MAG: GTP 3',8-cyclase MoaA [Wenzhouxiangellaceae bacterium]